MTRIVLYTDQPILTQGLRSVFTEASSFELQAVASTMPELMEIRAAAVPDILLLDLTSEVTFGALTEMKRVMPHAKIVLWVHTISTELAFQAMGLGVRGILRKTLPTDLLAKCLGKVQEGELWVEKALTDSFLSAKRIALTKREGQLVSLLSQGLKNKEIATVLMIYEGTVKDYLSRLFQKLLVKDRVELALYGLKNLSAGPGAVNRSPFEDMPSAGSLPVSGLRSIVLERAPEKVAPSVAPSHNIRRLPTVRPNFH